MKDLKNYNREQEDLKQQLLEQTRLMEQLEIDIHKREQLIRAVKH